MHSSYSTLLNSQNFPTICIRLAISSYIRVFSLSPSVGNVWINVLRGPLEVLGGAVTGVALGYFLHYFPSRDQVGALRQPFDVLFECVSHIIDVL